MGEQHHSESSGGQCTVLLDLSLEKLVDYTVTRVLQHSYCHHTLTASRFTWLFWPVREGLQSPLIAKPVTD